MGRRTMDLTVQNTAFGRVAPVKTRKRISTILCRMLNIYRMSQEEGTKLREGVPYVKLYRKTPKYLYPMLNGLGDNGN
jgi:hypothetical protein